jgi:hypothetical protein
MDIKSGVHLREGYFRAETSNPIALRVAITANSQFARLLRCVRYETLFLSGANGGV